MRHTPIVLVPTVLLSFIAAAISYHLLVKHEVKSSGLRWFDTMCEGSAGDAGLRSCDRVMASEWGTFPPVPKDVPLEKREEPRTLFVGLSMRPRPVALFGVLYFSVLGTWYLAVGCPTYARRRWHLVPLCLNTLGVVGALFFTYIMFFTNLMAWCPWCLVAHVCNGLVLVGAVLLWPRESRVGFEREHLRPPDEDARREPTSFTDNTASVAFSTPVTSATRANDAHMVPYAAGRSREGHHPTTRHLLVTAGGIVALLAAEWYGYEYRREAQVSRELVASLERLNREFEPLRRHAATLYAVFQEGDEKEISIRPDDPVKNGDSNELMAVVISDFRCPHCGRFAKYMRDVVEPLFDGRLSLTFKHFPAEKECNRYMRRTLHARACRASAAAEAARMLGGTASFWMAHDLLFEAGNALDGDEFYLELPDRLGLDRARFVEVMESDAVAQRIAEDIELAIRIGLRGTPAVYLDGRLVPSLSREQDLFWEEVKRRHGRSTESRRGPGANEG